MTNEQERRAKETGKEERVLFTFSIADEQFSVVESGDDIILQSRNPAIPPRQLEVCPQRRWNTSTSQSVYDERGETNVGFSLQKTTNDQVRFRASNQFRIEYWYYGSVSDDWSIRHDMWVNRDFVVSRGENDTLQIEEIPDENARLIKDVSIFEIELENDHGRQAKLLDASFDPEFVLTLEEEAEKRNAQLVGYRQLSSIEILRRMSGREDSGFLIECINDWGRYMNITRGVQHYGPYAPYRVYGFDPDGHDKQPEPGKEDTYIIFLPSQPFDDDVYAVSWTGQRWERRVAGYGTFGEPKVGLDKKSAKILLEYFGLLDYPRDFPPSKLQSLSPEDLIEESKKRTARP